MMTQAGRNWGSSAVGGGNGDRGDYINSIKERLRALFPDGVDHAAEKRAELLSYAAGEALGRDDIRDVAAAEKLPVADLEKVWRVVDRIVDAH
jgi:hypothetical protein